MCAKAFFTEISVNSGEFSPFLRNAAYKKKKN